MAEGVYSRGMIRILLCCRRDVRVGGGMCGRGACMVGDIHGEGHTWQGVCMVGACVVGEGMCGRGHVWWEWACIAGGHV